MKVTYKSDAEIGWQNFQFRYNLQSVINTIRSSVTAL